MHVRMLVLHVASYRVWQDWLHMGITVVDALDSMALMGLQVPRPPPRQLCCL